MLLSLGGGWFSPSLGVWVLLLLLCWEVGRTTHPLQKGETRPHTSSPSPKRAATTLQSRKGEDPDITIKEKKQQAISLSLKVEVRVSWVVTPFTLDDGGSCPAFFCTRGRLESG